MDNWGDPWADNADNAKSPTKPAVTSPLPQPFAPASTLLNGFLDDAGWGNDDDSFGDWSTAPATVSDAAPAKTSMNESYTPQTFEHNSDDTTWDKSDELHSHAPHDEGDWAGVELDVPMDEEKVASETSDTSTTIQATEVVEDPSLDASPRLQPDDASSTRASTSPSETSHNDVPTESPRTSYEEEHRASQESAVSGQRDSAISETSPVVLDHEKPRSAQDPNHESVSDASLAPEVEVPEVGPINILDCSSTSLELPTLNDEITSEPVATSKTDLSETTDTFVIDSDLLHELFPPLEEEDQLEEPPDDPIYSISARRAWYRLTRKQTMREHNNGDDDDNYIRVTWANSHIRSEVNKVVGRWAREDRISGTGPGARASFYWDTPAPTNAQVASIHNRQHSSQPASVVTPSKRESIPLLSTNTPAAFSWSSAPAPIDPWHQESTGLRSTSSPIAPIHPHRQQEEQRGRGLSLDLASQTPTPATGMQTLTSETETPAVAGIISPPAVNTTSSASDLWAGLDTFDTKSAPKEEVVATLVDDDDEWGEMVSTPTVSTFATTTTTTQPKSVDNYESISTPITPPHLSKSALAQDQSPEAMHAAPIVRLKSTISPTSALFKANSFVPLGAEQGPIGPGILKSAKRVASVTANKVDNQPPLRTQLAPSLPVRPVEISRTETSDVFSTWQTSAPEVAVEKKQTNDTPIKPASPVMQEHTRPTTPLTQSTASSQSNVDAWADADFSLFESSLPVALPSQPKQDGSDAISMLESPARPTSSASLAKTFSRSPPRKITPPPVQPLTGATSSAQRRKNEEEQIIHEILGGLPNLSYMLIR